MPTALTEVRRVDAPVVPRWLQWAAAAIAVLLATLGLSQALQGPRFVAQVTFVNSSPYALDVQVASAHSTDWTLLGTIEAGSQLALTQVVDQGGTWVFDVSSQGVHGGSFTVARSALEAAGWRVTIPQEIIARLRAQNVFGGTASS